MKISGITEQTVKFMEKLKDPEMKKYRKPILKGAVGVILIAICVSASLLIKKDRINLVRDDYIYNNSAYYIKVPDDYFEKSKRKFIEKFGEECVASNMSYIENDALTSYLSRNMETIEVSNNSHDYRECIRVNYGDKISSYGLYDYNGWNESFHKNDDHIEVGEYFYIVGPWEKTANYNDGKGYKRENRKYYRDIYVARINTNVRDDFFNSNESVLEFAIRNNNANEIFSIGQILGEVTDVTEEQEKEIQENKAWSLVSAYDGSVMTSIPTAGKENLNVASLLLSIPTGVILGYMAGRKKNNEDFDNSDDKTEISTGPDPEKTNEDSEPEPYFPNATSYFRK